MPNLNVVICFWWLFMLFLVVLAWDECHIVLCITTAATFVHWLLKIQTPTCFMADTLQLHSDTLSELSLMPRNLIYLPGFCFIVFCCCFFFIISRKTNFLCEQYETECNFFSVRITQITQTQHRGVRGSGSPQTSTPSKIVKVLPSLCAN